MIVSCWGLHTTRIPHAKAVVAARCGWRGGGCRWEPAGFLRGGLVAVLGSRRACGRVGEVVLVGWGARRTGAGKSGDTGGVAGMRITLSGAMRARDVSRPTDEQLEAAAEREARITRSGRPSGASSARGGVGPGGASGGAGPGGGGGGVGPGGAAPVGGVVAARGGPAVPSAAPARTDQPRTGPAGSAPARTDPARTEPARAKPSGSAGSADGTGRGSAGSADGTGRDGSPAGGGAVDEVPSATRRRRRRRGR
jgi:hypothetical protein